MSAPPSRSPVPHPAARPLRLAGVIVLLATLAFWATAGAHRGWSQNRVPLPKTDEVTGLTYVEYQDRFVPGVDVLAGGVGLGLALALASVFLRRRA